ncbi:MAG TPA: acetylornithine deacetylase [Agitococcus sp.]|mgnify:FL=1|nr:acetylornithine deacetylase [Agitococcus sp.]HMY28747.1 acetylornithine deacetylase [Agitococcus sp.]HNB19438.1 acetylornithine deacetylase [Agitococcus sp.]HNC86458.1 acetylornithine deacetylase [Agitococcus sp.]HNG46950.1 acetylornithine deacetylase [Agitococcus sp.]
MDKLFLQQLSQLVALPSVSCTDPNIDQGNQAVIDLLASWLSQFGFNCEIMPISVGKANLIATLGSGSGGLVLAGHTDTVPCDAQLWASDPFKVSERNGNLYGLGIADMKGFFPAVLNAAQAFSKTKLKAPLIIIATCDEESSMAGAKALVEASKPQARFALIGEPTSLKPIRLHKGVMMERVKILGNSGHSSDPSLGNNALDAMTLVMSDLMAFRAEMQKKYHNPAFTIPYPTLNLGCIHGGDNPNRICGQCELQFDLRPLPDMNMDDIRQQIAQRLKRIALQQQIQIEYEAIFEGTPPAETPADSPFVKMVERLTQSESGSVAFGTEAPYFRQLGMDTIILGAGSIETAHQPNEYLPIKNISPLLLWLKQLIHHYCVLGYAA